MPQPIEQLTQKIPFKRVYYKTLQRGSLVSAHYTFWKHDAVPLILVTDVTPDGVRGINLHYLTLRYIKELLKRYCGKNVFTYQTIKHDQAVVNAFRSYKRIGLRQIQMLDCDVVMQQLNIQRSYNPQEIKALRQRIQDQLRKQTNPRAEDMANQFTNMLNTPQGKQINPMDGRRTFRATPTIPTQSATIAPQSI